MLMYNNFKFEKTQENTINVKVLDDSRSHVQIRDSMETSLEFAPPLSTLISISQKERPR